MSVKHRELRAPRIELFEFDGEKDYEVLRQIADWLDGRDATVHAITYDNRFEDGELKQSWQVHLEDFS